PVINPIVIASTLSAFGFGPIFWGRIGITLGIAVVTGFLFSLQPDAAQVLRHAPFTTNVLSEAINTSRDHRLSQRFQRVFIVAADEFIEMGKFLVAGALLAALLQTFVPQNALLALGSGPALSPLIMATLAAILSICSTVDAFIALAFTNTFSAGSILTFLVFGPMVDIKSVLMYLRVFRRRTVVYLVMIPLLLSLLAGLMMNLTGGM
ncbi:permease, partial [bacterium]|nr:permease [bacterium]